MSTRRVFEGIRHVLTERCGWRAVPERFGSGATLHRYYQEWQRAGVLARLADRGVFDHDRN